MKNVNIRLIGAASGLAAQDQGTEKGPRCLQKSAYVQQIIKENPQMLWHKMIDLSTETGLSDEERISQWCLDIAQSVNGVVRDEEQFVVLGGDHSSAIGTWSGAAHALSNRGDIGLLWIDAHLDAHTMETSPSGAIHGMPVASLLGYGLPSLTQLMHAQAKLKPENLCIVGARSFEPGEYELLQRLGVKIYFIEEVLQRGMELVLQEALAIVSRAAAGFGISLDLDAIDPQDAPGIGSPESGGFSALALCEALQQVYPLENFIGLEITEFNPQHDKQGKTEQVVCQVMQSILA